MPVQIMPPARSDYGQDAVLQLFPKIDRATPNDVVVVVRVEVQSSHGILMAREDHWDSDSMCKSSLVIDATSRTVLALGEVRDQESGSSNLGNDLVIDSVDVSLPIDLEGLIACLLYGCFDTSLQSVIHAFVKPHCDEALR